MTLKGSHKLIDALLYLKISGSLVVASTEVSECMCGSVCVCVRACLRVASFVGLSGSCVYMCVCMCVQKRVSRFALPLSLSIVGEESPQSLGGWGKSDVSRE